MQATAATVAARFSEFSSRINVACPTWLTPEITEGATVYWVAYLCLGYRGNDFCNSVSGIVLDKVTFTVRNEFEAIRDLVLGAISELKPVLIAEGQKLTISDIAFLLGKAITYRHGRRVVDKELCNTIAAAFMATGEDFVALIS